MVSERDKEEFNFRRNKPEFADQGDSEVSGSNTWENSDPYGSGGSLGSSDFGNNGGGSLSGFLTSNDPPSGGSNPFGGGGDNPFGGGGGNPFGGDSAFGGSGLGGFGNDPFGGNQFGQPEQQQKNGSSLSEVGETLGKAALLNSTEAAKTFTKSLSSANSKVFNKTAYFVTIAGASYTAVVVLIMILTLFAGFKNTGSLLIGGILAGGVGLLVLSMTQESAKKHDGEQIDLSEEDPVDGYQEINESSDSDFKWDSSASDNESSEESGNNWWEEADEDSEDGDDGWGDEEEDDWDDEDEDTPAPPTDIEEIKKDIDKMPEGMYTRQFLFEQFVNVLPKINPYFSNWIDHDIEESDVVIEFESYINEVANVLGYKGDDELLIHELRENDFMYELSLTRPIRVDVAKFSKEFGDIYASRKATDEYGQPSETVYTRHRTSGEQLTISLFKGNGGSMVSIADALTEKNVKEMFLDTSIDIPMVLGVNERGIVNKLDFSRAYSALVSGMPRKGKSWLVLAMLAQICAFNSPKQVTFYIGDNKNYTSDFYGLQLPHIKQFEGEANRILQMLKWIVEVEGPRRKKLIGDSGGEVNYNNYISAHPESIESMPKIYVIIDEMMALKEAFGEDKEKKSEYFGYLTTITSQFPGLGIYFWGIPHRVKNETIPKNVYSLIPFNINVVGSTEDIIDALGCKPNEFPYNLSQVGETGARISEMYSNKPFYNKGVVISKSKEYNDKVFECIRYMWSKIDHEFYHGPRIDMHDMKQDRFDNYECGCKSHGGIASLPLEGFSSKNNNKPVQNPFNSARVKELGVSGVAGKPRGGFTRNEGQVDSGSTSFTRLDSNGISNDVSSDWDIPGLDG